MLERNSKGKLALNTLDLQIFLGDLFVKCEDEHEIMWLTDEITGIAGCIADERREEL
ncbi:MULTISPECIES: hypothetical protein [Clostridium]|uniref:hypothetical protein n=1 Tax=Clostridium TaxID=1485 RepID=UPI000A918607|nr:MULTISPECIES: hypothetical protein [Clostridium]MDU1602502.1 hypothetical protein [Clostridium sp.]MZI79400.1 hypothetical protein [Clostridium butyricum]